MKKIFAISLLSLAAVTTAFALTTLPPKLTPNPAPEIDPAGAMSALTLLAGAIAVLRGRRSRR